MDKKTSSYGIIVVIMMTVIIAAVQAFLWDSYAADGETSAQKKLAVLKISTEGGVEPSCNYVTHPEGCWGKESVENIEKRLNMEEDGFLIENDA